MRGEVGLRHQRLAAGKAAIGIGAEILCRVVVGQLDQAPERPEKVAHRLVDHHPAPVEIRRLAIEIGAQHRGILIGREPGLDRQIAQIPHRIVHPSIFPIDDPHPFAGIEEILAQGVAMARGEVHRMRREGRADGFGLGDDVVIAVGQSDILGREDRQVIVDHGEQLEPEGDDGARAVQHRQRLPCPFRRAGAGGEGVGRHRHRAVDVTGDHDAACRIGVDEFGADTGNRGRLRGQSLDLAVDIFLGSRTGQAQAVFADPEDAVGQPAQPFGRSGLCQKRQFRDGAIQVVGVVGHAFSLSIPAS